MVKIDCHDQPDELSRRWIAQLADTFCRNAFIARLGVLLAMTIAIYMVEYCVVSADDPLICYSA
ncbi:hypothetical protein GCM10023228_30460 [Brevibacillus fulvus]